jgi:hypothetical protein
MVMSGILCPVLKRSGGYGPKPRPEQARGSEGMQHLAQHDLARGNI